jgi:MFS transporter, DHA2 family, multidrug resistance protein
MSANTDVHTDEAAYTPRFNPWLIAMTVTMATFMEVLDTSIANVALPHIAGSLSVSTEESTWVLTSYLVANAVILPLSGWLSSVLGRKRYYMISVFLFTVASALCGFATSIEQLVFFRVLQGLGGGGLQPSEQAILMDTFAPSKRGMAMAVYGVSILCAPVLGPTLGGFITDNYTWRWIFYINVPVGILSLILSGIVVEDPPYLKKMRAERAGHKHRVDFIGLGLLTIGLAALELALDKGQIYDWFGSRFIVRALIVAVVALVGAVIYELWHPDPIINLRLFKDRNFAMAAVGVFCAFAVLFGSTALLPQLLQTLMGYTPMNAGLVLSPAGLVTMLVMPMIGIALSKGVDARWLIVLGLTIVGSTCLWFGSLNLEIAPGQVMWPRICQTVGAGLLWVPINTAAYAYISKEQTSNASGLFNLIRNEGSSIGVSLTNTLLARRTQFHHSRLVEGLDRYNPVAMQWLDGAAGTMRAVGSDPALAARQAVKMLDNAVNHQASMMSYLDVFWLFAVLSFGVIPFIFMMKKAVSHGGGISAH